MSVLKAENKKFYLGEQEIKIHSGAMHYFRTVPEDWKDRLLKLKKCGLNTVETYVAWNLHEPKEGQFCFDGLCDIERFIQTATELGLYVIVRPGPYICAEWEFGGLPSWLLSYSDIKLRCMNERFLEKIDNFFDAFIPKITPYLTTNGGNVIAVQVENEYGSYGCDKEYLNYVKEGLIKRGVDVLLFTSDGGNRSMLTSGAIEGVLQTVNFGSDPEGNFAVFKERYPDMPMMCMEFWDGWFDHWGQKHVVRDAQSVADDIKYMVDNDMSFNFYMFHGGTNFGFMNGANFIDVDGYRPTVTSYDYDALLTEWGAPTEKYWKVKEILNPDEKVEFKSECANFGTFKFEEHANLFENLDNISTPVKSPEPLTFEELGTDYGFVLYRSNLVGERDSQLIQLRGLKDRAQIFTDGEPKATYFREMKDEDLVEIKVDSEMQLDILAENLGRINYGPHMKEFKGVTQGVWLGASYGNYVHGFTNYALPLTNLEKLSFKQGECETNQPTFLKSTFEITNPKDTFLKVDGLTKGIVFLNGFNLGKYWEIGPQVTLYVPASLLKEGKNELIVFEQHNVKDASFTLMDQHILSKEEN